LLRDDDHHVRGACYGHYRDHGPFHFPALVHLPELKSLKSK
jgi:hypothetical protein